MKRFSANTSVLQWIDHRLGAPACALLTLVRRFGGLFGDKDSAPPRSILNALPPAAVAARHILGHFLPGAVFGALAKAVPDRSVSYGKMCAAYEALGERDHGLESCRDALGRQGVRVEDFSRYVRLLLDHQGPATSAEQTCQ